VGGESFHADGRTDGRTDGQTDMTKLIVAFSNFVNTPKHEIGKFNICGSEHHAL